MVQRKGYVEIYTGNGKGKTTAALGVSLRTLLAGGSVFFAQFIKGRGTAELRLASLFPGLEIVQFGDGEFVGMHASEADMAHAWKGLQRSKEAVTSGKYDLVVLDEILVAILYGLLSVEDIRDLLRKKHEYTEVILTGRNAPQELIEAADLVTDMKNVKHYYKAGVPAREGIEF
ncbi:MAG: cob(I)yrinic acid a,c-diamide adenosyltransferase [Methanospirillaceae archaeon]|nr:cob(I)yrinic acid a,c-diamide adenosyltransferase [Methanospirillaceae archaeon]